MTPLRLGLIVALVAACSSSAGDGDSSGAAARKTTTQVASQSSPPPPVETPVDSTAKQAIAALAAHDMTRLSSLVHPTRGVRFSPYQFVDTTADRVLTRAQLAGLWTNATISVWGTHDGSGEPLRLTYPQYHQAFVYDADFQHAPKMSVGGEPMGRGTTTNNIAAVYPGAVVVEYHWPGSDPNAGGLDWKSLWLVFQEEDSAWYLVGIVHGAWTT